MIESRLLESPEEAASLAGVACRATWIDNYQERVPIAINRHRDYTLGVARRFAFMPQALARAAPKPGLAGLFHFIERLRVDISKHQNFRSHAVLNNRRHQSVVIELDDY